MDFFYLEYAVLAIIVVCFARRIVIEESKSNKDQGDSSSMAVKRGIGDTLGKKRDARKP